MQKQSYSLRLAPLKLHVHLGHLPPERRAIQTVSADIHIKFAAAPAACHSDELAGTLCYHQLTIARQTYCQARQFCLIEALTQQLYEQIKAFSPHIAALSLTITKTPPVEDLEQCAMTISDWA